ncbi:hypothetical protein J7E71_12575 [Mesobacillus foraminis]|uniref:hypothetical protein n=1 Tax=Mesobacillus foraminis TaxID=279826 RepID=UPI001BEB2ED4|nr:hypothetical protein [Mesobacillus foraminis]MBT2756790.1 hypothetical protein [Mesobacillus foraminis]
MKMKTNELVKFSILVGLMALFFDAIIGHGLFWKNDPYWNYWVVDTFLAATITCIACAFLGAGIWQGIIIMGIHSLVLELYYDFLSPVGLPQEPLWLSHYDVWIVGYVTHLLVYLGGYFLSLWIWRRKNKEVEVIKNIQVQKVIVWVALLTIVILIVEGIITQGILFREFFGFTFFIQRFVLTFLFLCFWLSYIGLDVKGVVTGALFLSLTWITYNMYLGPIGLPFSFPRYLSYNELWIRMFPGGFVSILIVLWILRKFPTKGAI